MLCDGWKVGRVGWWHSCIMLYAYGRLTIRQKLGEDSLVVIEVIDKRLLHQLNISIIKGFLLGCQLWPKPGQKKWGLSIMVKTWAIKSGGCQLWSNPGQQ